MYFESIHFPPSPHHNLELAACQISPGLQDACVLIASVASVVSDAATSWTAAHQAPLSMGFSRQGYWSGLPCPPPGDLPNPGVKPESLPPVPPGKLPGLEQLTHNLSGFLDSALSPLQSFLQTAAGGLFSNT